MEIWQHIAENVDIILLTSIGMVLLFFVRSLIRKIRDRKLLKTVTSINRGTVSERDLVLRLLKYGIPSKAIFHDLCIGKKNGKFAQIDLVLATAEGIVVFEVNHIESLKEQLRQFENIPFFSIIVFYGDCELKDIHYVPDGTFVIRYHRLYEVLKHIRENNQPAPYTDKIEIIRLLDQAVKNGECINIQEKHIGNIQDMVGKHRIYN